MLHRLCIAVIMLALSSCLSKDLQKAITTSRPAVDSLARDAARNAVLGIGDTIREVEREAISGLKGITDTLNPDIRHMMKLIDSIGNLGDSQLTKLANTLDTRILRLEAEVKDPTLAAYLRNIETALLDKANQKIRLLVSGLEESTLDSLTSPAAKQKLSGLLASTMSDSVRLATQKLVTGALQPTIDSLVTGIHTVVIDNLPFVEREARELLLGLAIVAACIIGYVWYQRRRYARLVQVLTYHINKIPVQGEYDQLTHEIQSQTQSENLERLLRSTLLKQGINH
jgi:hypothetical protein